LSGLLQKEQLAAQLRSRTLPLLVRGIDLVQGKSAEYRRAIGGVVYEAMVDVLKAPKDDRFQVIAEHPVDALIADENYLGIRRTQDCVFIN
jgi:4-oxalocrotonate tautomerase